MRALRDFNIPKIVTDDLPVFMGLIGDLFPALNVPRKRDANFEGHIKTAMLDLHLQPEDSFILKVHTPHCVFIRAVNSNGSSVVSPSVRLSVRCTLAWYRNI